MSAKFYLVSLTGEIYFVLNSNKTINIVIKILIDFIGTVGISINNQCISIFRI